MDEHPLPDPNSLDFAIRISTAPHAFEAVDQLLALAAQNPETCPPLAASAILLLTATLEMEVDAALYQLALEQRGSDPLEQSSPWIARTVPFSDRLDQLVELRFDGRPRLDPRNTHVRSLRELIRVRNRLMHPKEPPIFGTLADFKHQYDPQTGVLRIGIPIAHRYRNAWWDVDYDDASRGNRAVRLFLREVLKGQREEGQTLLQWTQ